MAKGKDSRIRNDNIVTVVLVAVIIAMGVYVFYGGGEPSGHTHSSMDHPKIEIPNGVPAPTVDIEVMKDSKSGINVHIVTTNFEFSPLNVGEKNIYGQGHAHIYLDDVKINRVYGHWYHIPDIKEGEHEIMVTLNSNDHSELTVDGEVIQDSVKIII